MKNKEIFLESEANEWFLRNKKKASEEIYNLDVLISWLEPFKNNINEILEVGSGSGHRLHQLCKSLEANGKGVEPSEEAVKFANNQFSNCNFSKGTSEKLEQDSESFDLVHLGFFLYLVDRQDYLTSIAEADRVTKTGGFLSIIDFDPINPYSNSYSHFNGLKSFKIDNSKVFIESGKYSLVNKFSFSHSKNYFSKREDERISLMLLYKEEIEHSYKEST